jgi:hypothetical protein
MSGVINTYSSVGFASAYAIGAAKPSRRLRIKVIATSIVVCFLNILFPPNILEIQ